MRTWIAAVLTLCGCATADLSKAASYADKAMAIVDVAANKQAAAYKEAVSVAVALCRADMGDNSTPEQRERCLQGYGFSPDQIGEIEEAYRNLAIAYDAIAEALEIIRESAPLIERANAAVKAVDP